MNGLETLGFNMDRKQKQVKKPNQTSDLLI